jgi:hypothetical protein
MAKIFGQRMVTNENEPNMMDAYPMRISSATLREKAYGSEDGLFLELVKAQDDKTYYYGLVGKKLHNVFNKDIGAGSVEELVGKYVIGRVKENSTALQDLIVDED